MKRLLAILLSTALLMGTVLPASASDQASDAELARVTQSVKTTLSLNTDDYSSFHGNYEDQGLASVWNLYWEGDTGVLSVCALADGSIIEYNLNSNQSITPSSQGLPSFPAGDPEQARAAAQIFLDRVLTSDLESVSLEEPSGMDRLDSTSYRFSGTILLHGLPSPLNYSLTVRASDGVVTRFWRDVPSLTFLGNIPSASPAVSQTTAAQSLQTTQTLRLEYILADPESSTATLCYLPNPVHTFYVDAQTGTLVDLTALEEDMYLTGGGNAGSSADASASESNSNSGFSEAEQAGIQQLEGVLSPSSLDQSLRAISDYGLSRYTLTSSHFSVGEPDQDGIAPVTCSLQYSRSSNGAVYTRTFTVDARTGQVEQIFSYIPWDDTSKATLTLSQAQSKAEAYLQAFLGDRYTSLALYDTPTEQSISADHDKNPSSYSFRFARNENGYFFPAQYYSVRIDATDGSVCGLSYQYDDTITFASPEGICSAETAMNAWMNTFEVRLAYLLVPQKLDSSDPIAQKLLQKGLTAFYHLKLGYELLETDAYRGIDAHTGTPLAYTQQTSTQGLTYRDMENHWSKDYVLRLAQFNVGYEGGLFHPDQTLTQWDLLCLLYSLSRYPLDPEQATDAQREDVYATAYALGILTRSQRNDEMILTRSQLIQYLLNGAGYGTIAKLEGIFTCSYPDRTSIPSEELGYAALAQGLHLVSGSYSGTSTATRAQATAMLYRLMSQSG